MLGGRVRILSISVKGHSSHPGIIINSPSSSHQSLRNTSQLLSKRNTKLTHSPAINVNSPLTSDGRLRLVSAHQISLSQNVRQITRIADAATRNSTVKATSQNDSTLNKSQVESNLYELRMKLERLGHLKVNDVNQVVRTLEQCMEELSDLDCLRLLQYCTRMAEEEYRPSGSLIQRVWHLTTHRKNGKVSMEHLESYLHLCRLEQSVNVSKRDIFEQIEKHGIEPNERVFEMLMMALGIRGHLQDTMEVLARMKERCMSVREATFAAFILAYGNKKDIDGIQGVLDTMKSAQVSMSENTYSALVIAWACMGNVWKVRQVLAQGRKERVSLTTSQMEAALFSLIKNGHAGENCENIDSVLRLVSEMGMKLDLSRMSLRLIYCGHVMEAVHLLMFLPLLRTNSHLYSNGAIYLREIVHARTDPELVVKACQRLQKEGINNFALQVALEQALKDHWEELSWLLLRTMKEAGLPIREHYFWPLLHVKAIAQEPSQLLECVRTMLQIGETPGFATLRDHIIPGLSLSQPHLALQMIQNTGLSATTTVTPLLVVLVKNNMMEHAIKFVQETKTPFSVGDAIDTLASAWHTKPKSIISLLAHLIHGTKQESSKKNTEDWGGQFLLHLATTRTGLGVHQIKPLFQELKKHGIGVSEYSADLLISKLNQPIQNAVRSNLHLVLQGGKGPPPQDHNATFPHPNSMSEEELEGHLEELRMKGLNTRGSLRRLLLLRASKNNTAGVMELMQSSSKAGLQLSAGMLSGVLEAYVTNGNTDAALELFSHITTEHPNFHLDHYKVLDLCTLLIQSGKTSEAEEILKNFIVRSERKIDTKNIVRNCRNLLLVTAEKTDPEKTENMYDLLLAGGFLRPETVTLGVLVKSRLNRGDLKGAVDRFKKIHQQYGCLTMRRELLIHLIHSRQTDSESECVRSEQLLQDTRTFIAKVKGPLTADHELLYAYIEAGRSSDAATVLRKLGRQLNQDQLNQQLKYYIKNENEAAVLHLLSASRGIDTINHHDIYSALLNIYYVQSEGEKGLSLWISMQEEDLTPSSSFLSTLGSLLAACKIRIPFTV